MAGVHVISGALAEGYEPRAGREGPPVTYQIAACTLALRIDFLGEPRRKTAIKKWILDWSAYPSPITEHVTELMIRIRHKTWDVDGRMDGKGNLTGVCFYRTPMAKS